MRRAVLSVFALAFVSGAYAATPADVVEFALSQSTVSLPISSVAGSGPFLLTWKRVPTPEQESLARAIADATDVSDEAIAQFDKDHDGKEAVDRALARDSATSNLIEALISRQAEAEGKTAENLKAELGSVIDAKTAADAEPALEINSAPLGGRK